MALLVRLLLLPMLRLKLALAQVQLMLHLRFLALLQHDLLLLGGHGGRLSPWVELLLFRILLLRGHLIKELLVRAILRGSVGARIVLVGRCCAVLALPLVLVVLACVNRLGLDGEGLPVCLGVLLLLL